MEEINENFGNDDGVGSKPSHNQRGPRSSERRSHRAFVLCLGLLSVLLMAGIIGLKVHCHVQQSSAEERDRINAARIINMTQKLERLQNLTEERDLLNAARIINMTQELERLQNLAKQMKTCPAGWRMFSGACYLRSDKSGSWDEGRKDCRDRGADLVVIDSHLEEVFLSRVILKDAWIGLTDREEEGTWKWVDGTPLTLTYWSKIQPDNGGGDPEWGEEDCAHIRNEDDTHWNDRSCETSMQWICEKK